MSIIATAGEGELEILGRKIGAGPGGPHGRRHRCLIIAELGINHNGDAARAREMVDVAADCGVDAVKLQRRCLRATYQERFVEHPEQGPVGLAHYIPWLQKCELAESVYPGLKRQAELRGLGFLVTPFDLPSVAFLEELGVAAYKVASCDATNPWLLDAVVQTGKPIIVSTGMTREAEVFALDAYLRARAEGRYAYMHSISCYPAAFRDCQLHMMLRYKTAFNVPVGWSGHERGVAVSVGAAALGADLIERHFTMDRTLPGPDHAASLEPDGLRKLVERVRAVEEAYGDPYMPAKQLNRGEQAGVEVLGKTVCARRAIADGEAYGVEDLEARSPGRQGAAPELFLDQRFRARRYTAMRAIPAGTPVTRDDLTRVAAETQELTSALGGRAPGAGTLSPAGSQ